MGIHDRKYMSDDNYYQRRRFSVSTNSFTHKYVLLCGLIYLVDALTSQSLTTWLCYNSSKVSDFEVWRLFSPFVMFTQIQIERDVFRIIGLVILYFLGTRFEEQIGKKNYINLFIMISLGQMIVALLIPIPSAIYLGYFSGILSGIFVSYGLMLGHQKMTLMLFFLIPLTLTGYMLAVFIIGVMVLFTLGDLYSWYITVPQIAGCFGAYIFTTQFQKGHHIDLLGWFQKKAKPKQKNVKPAAPKQKPTRMNSNQAGFSIVEEDEEIDDIDAFIQDKIDPILEKIATSGMSSLTAKEKKLLAEAKKKMGK